MIERLKIISSGSIISFESPCEKRVEKIADEIAREGRLRDPLLVTALDDVYLLLDNVNHYFALAMLNVDHIPVQLADVDRLSIRPWQRLLTDFSRNDLASFCARFPRKIYVIESGEHGPRPNEMEVRFATGERVRLSTRARSVLVRADICGRLFREISRRGKTFRDKVDYRVHDPFREYPEASAILFPPMFSLDELACIARHDERLPHGFVRPDQPGRVLGIDFSLSVLREQASLEEKESFFNDMLKLRLALDRIAYYNGAVFMYNS